MNNAGILRILHAVLATALLVGGAAWAQTTIFAYQGRLTDNGSPANGDFELQFKLYDVASGGVALGTPVLVDPVTVTGGIFTVTLDFGAQSFPGDNRFLEIGVRPNNSGAMFTVLPQRQQITSSPYAIQTLNAQMLNGLPASRYLASAANGNYGISVGNPTLGRLQVEGSTANAIYGHSGNGVGVYGVSTSYEGVRGEAFDVNHGAVVGVHSGAGIGVFGSSAGAGVQGTSTIDRGVVGTSTSGTGVYGTTAGIGPLYAGVHGTGTTAGSYGVLGEAGPGTSIGVVGVSGAATGFGMYARNLFGGRALYAEGHVTQSRDAAGIVKAMLEYVSGTGITRCFNSQTMAATGNCGFTISNIANGIRRIDFGFQVSDRFVMVSPRYAGASVINSLNKGVNYRQYSTNEIEIFTFETSSNDTTYADFTVLVF